MYEDGQNFYSVMQHIHYTVTHDTRVFSEYNNRRSKLEGYCKAQYHSKCLSCIHTHTDTSTHCLTFMRTQLLCACV